MLEVHLASLPVLKRSTIVLTLSGSASTTSGHGPILLECSALTIEIISASSIRPSPSLSNVSNRKRSSPSSPSPAHQPTACTNSAKCKVPLLSVSHCSNTAST
jgi:hypothetical protein